MFYIYVYIYIYTCIYYNLLHYVLWLSRMSIKLNEVEERTNYLKKWTQHGLNSLTQLCTHQHEKAVTQLSQLWLTLHTYWHKKMPKCRVASCFIHNETTPAVTSSLVVPIASYTWQVAFKLPVKDFRLETIAKKVLCLDAKISSQKNQKLSLVTLGFKL